MFLTPPQTEQSFKATIDELIRSCLNNDKKIISEQLPESISVGSAVWLIESIKQGTTNLDKTAIKAVERLHANISKMYYQDVQGIRQADINHNFEGKAQRDFIITREALVKYIEMQPFYSDVLATSLPIEEKTKEPQISQTYIQIIQNDVNFQLTKNENSHIDARIYNTEYSYHEAEYPEELPTGYLGDDVNIAVVTIILPELLPNKKEKLNQRTLNQLCNDVFNQLTEVLNANGAKVTDNLPRKNKKDGEIKGKEKNGNPIKLSYEALKKRVESRLIYAYQHDLPPEIHNI